MAPVDSIFTSVPAAVAWARRLVPYLQVHPAAEGVPDGSEDARGVWVVEGETACGGTSSLKAPGAVVLWRQASLKQVLDSVLSMSRALGCLPEAMAHVAAEEHRLRLLQDLLRGVAPVAVAFRTGGRPAALSWQHDAVAHAGGHVCNAEETQPPPVMVHLAAQPAAVAWDARDEERGCLHLWAATDGPWVIPGPAVYDAIHGLAGLLHPDRIPARTALPDGLGVLGAPGDHLRSVSTARS